MEDLSKPVYLEEKLKEIRGRGHLGYRSGLLPTWCPGCGYFSVSEGITKALNHLHIPAKDAVIVSGIGCASRLPFFLSTYGFHTLHGRTLPVATGMKLANDRLTVLAVGGDGDGFAIGGGHIPHAATRNVDITYLLLDNGIYGLTKGQTSPTSAQALKTTTTPYGHSYATVNPLMMVLSYGASWVAQAYAGDPHHLEEMIAQAIRHKGFSYLHILSPCVTFDKTSKTYAKLDQQVRALPEDHDTGDLIAAMREAARSETPALGLFYQEDRPTLGDAMRGIIQKARGDESSSSEASPAQ